MEKRFQCEKCEYATDRWFAIWGHARAVHYEKKASDGEEDANSNEENEVLCELGLGGNSCFTPFLHLKCIMGVKED